MAGINYSMVNLRNFPENIGHYLESQMDERGQFTHIPLDGADIKPRSIVFVLGHDGRLAFIGRLKRSQGKVAMRQRRLKGDKITPLGRQGLNLLTDRTLKLLSPYLNKSTTHLSKTTGEALRDDLVLSYPELSKTFEELEELLQPNLQVEYEHKEVILEQQKDATVLAMKVAGMLGMEREIASQSIDITAPSFLDSIEEERIGEDRLIEHDAGVFSDWSLQDKAYISSGAEFVNENNRMTVFTVNRRALEKVFGVDLIYVDDLRKSATFVQYKMMDRKTQNKDFYFYPNSGNHNNELVRMDKFQNYLDKNSKNRNRLEDIRANISPLFFKLCTVTNLKKDENNVAVGMYIPLDHWHVLLNSDDTLGPNGGRQIGFHTVDTRYFTTSQFVELLKRNMIGTRSDVWPQLSDWIKKLVAADKSVVIAIRQEINV